MPSTLTYPGVYIEEIPSGVRTITGVATSITAFIGAATAGTVNEPVICNSLADFERIFGGLSADLPLGYAVKDFYLNGGMQALIVRVAAANAQPSTITLPADGGDLVLEAASVGGWGFRLSAAVEHVQAEATTSPPPQSTRFNLLVRYQPRPDREEVLTERFLNLSVDANDIRFVTRVLENESSYLRAITVPGARPHESIGFGSPPGDIHWEHAVGGDDGSPLVDADIAGDRNLKSGIYALLKSDLFNLLCIPPKRRGERTSKELYQKALPLCVERRAMLIVDPDPTWGASADRAVQNAIAGRAELGLSGTDARNAALYFPCLRQSDPLRDSQLDTFVPCGMIAGIMARTDTQRGVWKAPAGLDASLNGVQGLQVNLNDLENGQLNQLGINCLRSFPVNGRVVWGARTLRGADQAADEYKYVPVRRLALFLEESLYRGTQWVVFEPNDEPLWGQIRLNIGAFMQSLFRQGAFQGKSPREAYLVKCDAETTTQNDINQGVVNILVGFAPLKPAEFVVIKIQQLAGQVQT
jgi:phage tail sheath protein FI